MTKKNTSSKKEKSGGRAPRKASGRSTAPVPSPKKAQGTPPSPSRAGALAVDELMSVFVKAGAAWHTRRKGRIITEEEYLNSDAKRQFRFFRPYLRAYLQAIKARDSDRKGAKRSPSSATEPLKSAGRKASPRPSKK